MAVFNRKLVFVFLLFISSIGAYAQTNSCPPNIDFEQGSFNFWNCYKGVVTNIGHDTMIPSTPVTAVATRHVITPTGYNGLLGLDPYGNFPVICPNGSGYSVKLGNDSTGAQSDRVLYYIHVPNVPNYNVIYQYAVVFENPSHLFYQQPNFTVTVYDSVTGVAIPCASYSYTASGNLPGFVFSGIGSVYYKPWTAAYIHFKNLGGHTMVLRFTVHDCTQGGHFGYGYVDVNSSCSVSSVTTQFCPGDTSAALHAPPSFMTYKWYDSSLTTLLDTNEVFTISPAPSAPIWYAVAITPYPGFGCPDTIWTQLVPQPSPIANFGLPQNYCAGSLVQFHDSTTTTTFGSFISNWYWDFGDPNATAINPNTSGVQNPTHYYNAFGTYTVCMHATNNVSCKSDTICKTITINQPAPPLSIFATIDTLCGPSDTTTLHMTSGAIPSGFTPYWSLDSATYLVSGNLNSTSPIVVKFQRPGLHYIKYDIQPPVTNDTSCWAHKEIAIYVKGVTPTIGVTGNSPICANSIDTIVASSLGSLCGVSAFACPFPTKYSIGTNNSSNSGGTPTMFQGAKTEGRCQMLYLASELTAAGMSAGTISGLSWNVVNKNSTIPYQGFSIKLACVTYDSFATNTMDKTTNSTLVYYAANQNTFAGVTNNFIFNTPYNWDGVSNLLVDVCFDNGSNNSTGSDRTQRSVTPVGQSRCVYARSDSNALSGCAQLYPFGPLAITTVDRPDVAFKACSNYISPTTNYSWTSTPAGASGSGSSIVVSPTVTTTYNVVADDGGCSTTKSFIVVTTPQTALSAIRDTLLCGSDTIQLNVSSAYSTLACGTNSNTCGIGTQSVKQVGTGTVVTTSPNITPFNQAFKNSRMLIRYSAADLATYIGGGAPHPVTITKIGFNITTKNSNAPYTNFNIKIGCYSPTAVMPSSFPALSLVYTNASYVAQLGWNNFTLNNTFDWDGASDLLVEVCYANTISSNSDVVERTTKASNCVLIATNSGGGSAQLGCVQTAGSPNTATTSASRPNCIFTVCDRTNTISDGLYSWTSTPASVIANTANPVVHPTVTTTYVATINSAYYCPKNDTVVVTISNGLTVKANNDTLVCPGNVVALNATSVGANTWNWVALNGGSLSCTNCLNPTVTINQQDTFIVTATTLAGCVGTDTVHVLFAPNPTATFTATSPICIGDSSLITYTGSGLSSAIYSWNFNGGSAVPGGNSQGPNHVHWSTAGDKKIYLSLNQNGCVSVTDSQTVTVIPVLTSSFSKNNPHCLGDTLQLNYTGTSSGVAGINYVWTTPGGTQIGSGTFIKVVYDTAGTHIFSLQTAVGASHLCASVTTDSVTLYTYPTSTFTATSPICLADSSLVTYTGNGTALSFYDWNFNGGNAVPGGVTAGPHHVNFSTAGSHTIYLQAMNNVCATFDSATVIVIPTLTSSFSKTIPNCTGDTMTLIYTGTSSSVSGLNFIWNTPSGIQIGTGDTIKVIYNTGGTHVFSLQTDVGINHICPSITFDSVTINTYPTAAFTATSPICLADSSLITYTGTGDALSIYTWNFNGGNAMPGGNVAGPHHINFSTSGNQTIYLNVANGTCSSNDSATINVIPLLTSSFDKNNPTCLGDTLKLMYNGTSGNVAGINFVWNTPGGIQIGSGDTIQVIYTTAGNHIFSLQTDVDTLHICASITVDSVYINFAPTATFTATSPICFNDRSTVTYTGTGDASTIYNWNFGIGNATPPAGNFAGPYDITWTTAGTYPIYLTATNGFCSNNDSAIVRVIPQLSSTFTKNNPTCLGDTLMLIYTGGSDTVAGVNIVWTTVGGNQIIHGDTVLVTYLTAGKYYFSLTVDADTNHICSTTTIDSVTINFTPTAKFTASSPICLANSSMINYTGTGDSTSTYTWNFAGGTANPGGNSAGPHSVTWTTDSTYTIYLNVSNGVCGSLDSATVQVLPTLTSSFSKNNPTCLGQKLNLTYTGTSGSVPGINYTWNTPGGTQIGSGTAIQVTYATAGTHVFSLQTDIGGTHLCSSITFDSITINYTPTATFTATSPVCLADSSTVIYTGTGNASTIYTWNFATGNAMPTGNVGGTHHVNWSTSGNHQIFLTAANGVCSSTDSATVNVIPLLTSSFSKNNPHCIGDTLQLNYTGTSSGVAGINYLWTTPGGTQIGSGTAIKVIYATGGTHVFSLQTAVGGTHLCPSITTDSVTIYTNPTATFTATSPICLADSSTVIYTGTGNASTNYAWNFNSGNAMPTGNVGGTHHVNWSTSGTKKIVLTTTNGGFCTRKDSVNVTVIPLLTSSFSKNNPLCLGDTLKLNYTGISSGVAGINYVWTTPGGTQIGSGTSIKVVYATASTHVFSLQTAVGASHLCPSITTDSITLNFTPTSTFTASTPVCQADSSTVIYTGNGNATSTYTWNFTSGAAMPTGNVGGTHHVHWTTSGNHKIYLTTANASCSSKDSATVNVIPALTSSFSKNNPLCLGDTLKLNYTGTSSGVAGINYVWTTTGGTQIGSGTSIKVVYATAGTHVFSLQTAVGGTHLCPSITIDSITLNFTPTAAFTVTSPICLADSSTIIYTGTGTASTNYVWNFSGGTGLPTGSVGGTHHIHWSSPGNFYTVSLNVNNGSCASSHADTVVVLPTLSSTFSKSNAICMGDVLQLIYTGSSSAIPGINYTWTTPGGIQTGSGTSITVSYATAGTHVFSLQTDVGSGHICPSITTDSITLYNYPTATFTVAPPIICLGSTTVATFTGTASAGALLNWNYGGGSGTPGTQAQVPETIYWNVASTYNVILEVNDHGCKTSDTAQVQVTPALNASFHFTNTPHCVGDSVKLAYTGTSAGVAGVNFIWKDKSGNVIGNTAGPINAIANAAGYYLVTLQVSVGSSFQCAATFFDSIFIRPNPTANFVVDKNPICSGDNILYTFSGTTNPLGSTPTYSWLFANGTPNSASNVGPNSVNYINNSGAAQTNITSLTVSQDGCSATFTKNITVNILPTASITGVAILCNNDATILYVVPNTFSTYLWNNGTTADSLIAIGGVNNNVFVVATDANGCVDTAYHTIASPGALPVANAGRDTSVLLGNSVQLDGSLSVNAVTYSWTPASTLSDSSIMNPIATTDSTQIYILTITDAFGCTDVDTVVLTIDNNPNIVLPNAFTPNGDGENDIFIHKDRAVKELIEFSIFNRWGEKIFTTNDMKQGWDGKYKGVPQDVGTYVFSVNAVLKDGTQKVFKGNFHLLR